MMSEQEQRAKFWADIRRRQLDEFRKGVPKKYRDSRLTDFPAGVRKVVGEWFKNPFSWLLYVQGDVGRGKTRLAFAAAIRWTAAARNGAIWWAVPELLARLRHEFDQPRAGRRRDLVGDLQGHPGLLMLDDLGAEKDTDFAIQELYRIVYMREAEDLKTIITSNYTPSEIGDKLSHRIMSRMASGDILKLRGVDRRIKP